MFRVTFLSIILFLAVSAFAHAEILFTDDFEKDQSGKEPSKWEKLNFASGNATITVEQDPTAPKNKVAKTNGIGLYIPKVAGREKWRDYIWDFDWMWENDSFVGTIYRVENAEAHFHGSRRTGAVDVQIYTRKAGNWALVAGGQFPNKNNVWYSHRLVVKGSKHQIFLKEREEQLPPVDWHLKLKPVVEADNDSFKTGPVGMMGITSGVSYFDNMVVVESIEDLNRLRPVDPRGKLAMTWGVLKKRF